MLHCLTLENLNDDARDACSVMENVMDKYLSTIWSVLEHNVSVLECVLRHWSISIGVLVVMLEQKGNNAEVLDIRSSMVAILDECLSTDNILECYGNTCAPHWVT